MITNSYNGKLRTFYISLLLSFLIVVQVKGVFSTPEDPQNKKNWVIVIDPGHGDWDPGAVGKFSYEKDVVLKIALRTGDLIKRNLAGVKVIYTRDDDTYVDLYERANIANKNKADLFISIHANGNPSSNAKGTETYIMGLAKDQANLEVAMKENAVITLEEDYSTKYEGFDPNSPESYIIFTLMQNVYREQSTNLAAMIQSQYKEKVSKVDRGVQEAGFIVLFTTAMPSVLTEIGFITNPAEEKYLNSKEGQESISSAIYRACRDYINDVESKSGISVSANAGNELPDKQPSDSAAAPSSDYIFSVQIASSTTKKQINPKNFKGFTNISEIFSAGSYKYVSGNFSDYTEAAAYRKKLENSFPGAFVVATKENKIVPLQEAIENQSKNKNLLK
jgi:N-acetylmuramoyl-L-alanine amidase